MTRCFPGVPVPQVVGNVVGELWRRLAPEIFELVEGELLTVEKDVIGDVHDEAFFFAAVERAAQATTDHLLVEDGTVGGAGDVEGTDRGRVETGGEDGIVGEDAQFSCLEGFNVMAPCARICT